MNRVEDVSEEEEELDEADQLEKELEMMFEDQLVNFVNDSHMNMQ